MLFRGTRQGCPLSDLLFAIEPLAFLLGAASDVTGLARGNIEEKVALYADNIILFLINLQSSVPAVMSYMDEFARLSGLAINREKYVLLSLDSLLKDLPAICPQLVIVSSFKYLVGT